MNVAHHCLESVQVAPLSWGRHYVVRATVLAVPDLIHTYGRDGGSIAKIGTSLQGNKRLFDLDPELDGDAEQRENESRLCEGISLC